jgi:drug/metabolite transporter (DMT)-like permease
VNSALFANSLIGLTNCCWGLWGILDKKALENSLPRNVMLIQYFLALPEIIVLIAYMVLTNRTISINAPVAMWTSLGCVSSLVAMVAYLVAMSRAEASFVLGITASYPLVMQFFAASFLGETLVGNRLIGAGLIGAGVFAVGHSAGHKIAQKGKQEQVIILVCVILATVGWGIHGLFDKKAVGYASPLMVSLIRCVIDFLTFVVMYFVLRTQKPAPAIGSRRTWMLCGLSAVCMFGGYLAYLKALMFYTASYVIVITGCYPLLMYIFALVFLKEKLNPVRLFGVILVVAGGALVQLTQSQ